MGVIRGSSYYKIVNGPTWTEAETNSNKLGGHLVTINDDDEFNWILDNYSDYETPNATDDWQKNKVWCRICRQVLE